MCRKVRICVCLWEGTVDDNLSSASAQRTCRLGSRNHSAASWTGGALPGWRQRPPAGESGGKTKKEKVCWVDCLIQNHPDHCLNNLLELHPFIVKAAHLRCDVCVRGLKRLEFPPSPHFYRTACPYTHTNMHPERKTHPEVSRFSPQWFRGGWKCTASFSASPGWWQSRLL